MRALLGYLCLWAGAAYGGEFAVLTNGARLHADRHEVADGKVRLIQGSGFIELDAARIQGFDIEESSAPALPAGQPVISSPTPSSAPSNPLSVEQLADAAADRYGLPRTLVRSVIAAESGFQPGAVSPKGAIGLMQLMPGTAKDLGVDPYDPAQNIDAGARYLKSLLERYDYGLWHALAAYNAGPGAVDKYHGVPPYRETINYVRRIDRKLRDDGTIQP
jgi:soluble lytic murein transglycosylase-like protein